MYVTAFSERYVNLRLTRTRRFAYPTELFYPWSFQNFQYQIFFEWDFLRYSTLKTNKNVFCSKRNVSHIEISYRRGQ